MRQLSDKRRRSLLPPRGRVSARIARALAAACVSVAASASSALAQYASPVTGRVVGSAQFLVSEPRGDFGLNTDNGFGVGGSLLFKFDPGAILNWRLDGSVLNYGRATRRIPLAGTGGLVKLDLRTTNNIASFLTGPQLLGPTGPIVPYATALGGLSVFWTESSVEGSQDASTPFASTTNSTDAVFAYGGAVGAYVRLANGSRPIQLDFGARVLRHDDVRYLNDKLVRDAFEQNRDPLRVRGRADFVTYYLGVSAYLY